MDGRDKDLISASPVAIGLENCLASPPEVLQGARFGLLMNQASLDARFRYAHELLAARFPGQLVALFSPQHGWWGEQQANMIESPHTFDERLRLPIYSLYAGARRPTREMLAGLDCLVVDLQDVGTRVYTFIWTVSYCLEACAEAGIPLVVLDRPNPLGGLRCEGPMLDPSCASFVGRAPIPMRHGLTLGELARAVNELLGIGAAVEVVGLSGWWRSMQFQQTGRAWTLPSPNLPRVEGVQFYPGSVLLEGTNLSEGRGTTTPFEIVGAPFVEPKRLLAALAEYRLPGVMLRPLRFTPTFDKWQGVSCGGVYLHELEADAIEPYRLAVAILGSVARLWPAEFRWLPPPYEYETEKPPIDIISGGTRLREAIDRGVLADSDLDRLAATEPEWQQRCEAWRLYEDAADEALGGSVGAPRDV